MTQNLEKRPFVRNTLEELSRAVESYQVVLRQREGAQSIIENKEGVYKNHLNNLISICSRILNFAPEDPEIIFKIQQIVGEKVFADIVKCLLQQSAHR